MSALVVGLVIAFFARLVWITCSGRSHWVTARVVGELPRARARALILPCCAWSLGESCSKCRPSWRVDGLAPVYRDGRLVEPTAIPGRPVPMPRAGPGIPCKH